MVTEAETIDIKAIVRISKFPCARIIVKLQITARVIVMLFKITIA